MPHGHDTDSIDVSAEFGRDTASNCDRVFVTVQDFASWEPFLSSNFPLSRYLRRRVEYWRRKRNRELRS